MRNLGILIGIGALGIATSAAAHDTDTAYASRGECESASSAMSNAEKNWLVVAFPSLFDTTGEAASFLTKAWTCDPSAGEWYITDHRQQVLDSAWYARRNH